MTTMRDRATSRTGLDITRSRGQVYKSKLHKIAINFSKYGLFVSTGCVRVRDYGK